MENMQSLLGMMGGNKPSVGAGMDLPPLSGGADQAQSDLNAMNGTPNGGGAPALPQGGAPGSASAGPMAPPNIQNGRNFGSAPGSTPSKSQSGGSGGGGNPLESIGPLLMMMG